MNFSPCLNARSRSLSCAAGCWLCLASLVASALGGEVSLEGDIPIRATGVSEAMESEVKDTLTHQLALANDKTASLALADDLMFFVTRQYQQQGYRDAAVDYSIEGGTILLAITEGVQQRVGKTAFPGNPALAEDELRRYLLRPTRERVGRLAKHTPYVVEEIAAGSDLLLRYLISEGYADAAVETPTTQDGGEAVEVDITLVLHPGEQWHIGEVELADAPASAEKEMRLAIAGLHGQTHSETKVESARRSMEAVMQAQGYFKAAVAATTTRGAGDQREIQVRYVAKPGPLFMVATIESDAAFSRGATRLIMSNMRPTVGRVFDPKRTELGIGHVLDTGIFERLEMEPIATGENELALRFAGVEGKPQSLGISGGFDTFLGLMLGLEYKNVNFWDSGGMLRVQVLGTQLGFIGSVKWVNPAFFNTPNSLTVTLQPETFVFEGYERKTASLRTELSRDITSHLALSAFAAVAASSVDSLTLTEQELGPQSYGLTTLGLTSVYEGRDNPVSPTRGWYGSLTAESGVGVGDEADFSFYRTEAAVAYYFPIVPKWRGAVGMHMTSLISDQAVTEIPIELRTYNGGAKGVRSFAERELGPQALDGTHLGGTQSQTLSGEVSYELFKNFEVAGFVDAGSLSTDAGSVLPQFTDVRYAAGLGLRYRLPFGPLRIDYGVNLDRREGEAMGALHVGFGFAF